MHTSTMSSREKNCASDAHRTPLKVGRSTLARVVAVGRHLDFILLRLLHVVGDVHFCKVETVEECLENTLLLAMLEGVTSGA